MKKWIIEKKKLLKDLKIFNLFEYKMNSPYEEVASKRYNFYVFESLDWINILPITKEKKVVFVEQYRPGTDSITLELPGGMADLNEKPINSAKRELLEETGFSTNDWSKLGWVHPNPAILNNICHTFIALNVQEVAKPMNSGSEFTNVRLVDLEDLDKLVIEGKITHSLVINAIYWYKIFDSNK
ncbi:MAG: NUDIX hydrolase [Thermodesulfobacteriota bacterium]|jgi:8-oxo-dGTP pyrophosphatase MutT (NUDIX family)|nr:MAG: NUDIX hydrolase [Candidatus Dadabacteria bacterium]